MFYMVGFIAIGDNVTCLWGCDLGILKAFLRLLSETLYQKSKLLKIMPSSHELLKSLTTVTVGPIKIITYIFLNMFFELMNQMRAHSVEQIFYKLPFCWITRSFRESSVKNEIARVTSSTILNYLVNYCLPILSKAALNRVKN